MCLQKMKKYKVVLSKNFRKDLKLAKKRNCNIELLDSIVEKIASGKTLEKKYKNHLLNGEFKGFYECHVQPDWLLIYKIEKNDLILFLFRTGSHSNLFKK